MKFWIDGPRLNVKSGIMSENCKNHVRNDSIQFWFRGWWKSRAQSSKNTRQSLFLQVRLQRITDQQNRPREWFQAPARLYHGAKSCCCNDVWKSASSEPVCSRPAGSPVDSSWSYCSHRCWSSYKLLTRCCSFVGEKRDCDLFSSASPGTKNYFIGWIFSYLEGKLRCSLKKISNSLAVLNFYQKVSELVMF